MQNKPNFLTNRGHVAPFPASTYIKTTILPKPKTNPIKPNLHPPGFIQNHQQDPQSVVERPAHSRSFLSPAIVAIPRLLWTAYSQLRARLNSSAVPAWPRGPEQVRGRENRAGTDKDIAARTKAGFSRPGPHKNPPISLGPYSGYTIRNNPVFPTISQGK